MARNNKKSCCFSIRSLLTKDRSPKTNSASDHLQNKLDNKSTKVQPNLIEEHYGNNNQALRSSKLSDQHSMHALTLTGLSSSLKLPSTQAHHKSTIISGNSLIPLCATMPAPLSCKNKPGNTRRNFIDKLEASNDDITFLKTESKISPVDSRDIEQFFMSESSINSHRSSESNLTDIETIIKIYSRDYPTSQPFREIKDKSIQKSIYESSFKRRIMDSSIRDQLKFMNLPVDQQLVLKSKSPNFIWNIKDTNLPQKLPKLGPITPDHFNKRKAFTMIPTKPKIQERRLEDLGEISIRNPLEIAEELSKLEWNSGTKDAYTGCIREDEFEIEVSGRYRRSDVIYKVDVC